MAEGTITPCAATAAEGRGAVRTPEFGAAAAAPVQLQQHQELGAFAPSSGSAGSSSTSSSSGSSSGSSSSGSSSCCDAVYAQRMAAFKSHPSAATCRTRRMELNALLRSQTRGDLLRQLREEAERQLQQQVELLTQQEEQKTFGQIRRKDYEGREEQTTPAASAECIDSRPLQHMLTHPQPIYEVPEELKAGEYMVALRPEGRSCLLLIRNGKGRVCDKNGETLYRVSCRNNPSRAAGEGLPARFLQPQQQQEQQQLQQQRLPLRLEELQELQSEESLFLPPVEKQRLLMEGARVFDVSHPQPSGGSGEHGEGEGAIAVDKPQKEVSSTWKAFRDPRKQQYRKQQKKVAPVMFLPCGVLSKGLTLLECVLCSYTPANVNYFSERFAAGSGDAAAAAATGTAAAAAGPVVITSSETAAPGAADGKEEEPMFVLLFVTDVLFLGGLMMGHCEFECRHFFLKSRMEEAPVNFHPLQLLPFVEATASHLHLLFSGPFLYPPDGFIFQHKLSPHVAGVNTLALGWRHEQISRFPIDEKNLGKFHVDAFLWVHPDGRVLSEDGVAVGEVDPEEFGVAAVSAPLVVRCWGKELDVHSGRFRSLQMAFLESPAHSRAPAMGTQHSQDFHRGDRTMDSVESTASAPQDAGSATAEDVAAAAAARREARRHRLLQRYMKDRSADCYAKLADQWLRIEGIHPVPFGVLCDSCPP